MARERERGETGEAVTERECPSLHPETINCALLASSLWPWETRWVCTCQQAPPSSTSSANQRPVGSTVESVRTYGGRLADFLL